jgi:hypothetical protein
LTCFRSHHGPGFDSASNRNEYRQCFLGGKGGQCVGLYYLHVPIIIKSGSVNLELSGPDYACTGIALPLSLLLHSQIRVQSCDFPHHRMDWGKIKLMPLIDSRKVNLSLYSHC